MYLILSQSSGQWVVGLGPKGIVGSSLQAGPPPLSLQSGGHLLGSRKMDFGFNFFVNVAWWELALVVLLLAAYALAPVLCVVAGSKRKEVEKCVAGQSAPRSSQRRGKGRGRGPIAG